MTVLHLIRHGVHELQGRVLVGRMPGVHLGDEGRRQVAVLAARLEHAPIEAIYCSPLERARETAEPIARRLGLEVELSEDLTEIDFGDWTGQRFEALIGLERWRLFNAFRSGTAPPNGEPMIKAQRRVVAMIERLRDRHPDGQVILVSHGDVIKGALAYWLGVPLDLFQRIEVDPGSLSTVEISVWEPRILRINEGSSLTPRPRS